MSVLQQMSPFFRLAAVSNVITLSNAVTRRVNGDIDMVTAASITSPATEELTIVVTLVNFAGMFGFNFDVTVNIDIGDTTGENRQIFPLTRDSWTHGVMANTVPEGYMLNITTPTVTVPAAPPATILITSTATRTGATTADVVLTVTDNPANPTTIDDDVMISIRFRNYLNNGVSTTFIAQILTGQTENVNTFGITDIVNTEEYEIDFSILNITMPDVYFAQLTPTEVTVPEFAVPITVTATATRTAANIIDWVVVGTVDTAPTTNISFIVQVAPVNGFGLNFNAFIQILSGQLSGQAIRTQTNSNTGEFTAVVQARSAFPPPDGYRFANLPFNVTVPVGVAIVGWNVSTGSFVRSQSVVTQSAVPNSMWFHPFGNSMFILDNSNDDVDEYVLTNDWNISTISYSRGGSVAPASFVNGFFFSDDGGHMYVCNVAAGVSRLYYYTLTTQWDPTTITNVNSTLFTAQDTSINGGWINANGSIMYLIGSGNDSVYRYNLSTAFNPSSATFINSFSVNAQEATPRSVFFRPTGRQMYVLGYQNDTVYEYHLTTPFDVATAEYVDRSLAVGSGFPAGIYWRADGLKMYIVDANNSSVYEYDIDP